MTNLRYHAPYMEWAKKRPTPRFDLAGSNVLACSVDDLEGARDALDLSGANDNGYPPLLEAIASRYGVSADRVTTANGAAGANFQVLAALVSPGDKVLVERPGYDPLIGAARLLGATITRFERRFEDGFALDPDRVRHAMTSRTKAIVITAPHNPTGVQVESAALHAIGRYAESAGAHVLVDEVYLDAADASREPAALLGDVFISTSSLTKSYGLASLRCGWSLSSAATAERIRRARDVIDGSGSIVAERLSALAFAQLPRLAARAAALLATNNAMVHEFMSRRTELDVVLPKLSTVLFPRLRGVDDTSRFAERLLAEHGTAIVPGRFFEAPAHFRIGLGTSTDIVKGGLAQLAAALDAMKKAAS
jgi:aspartate/methionine/tyrosine aminotransferase